MKIIEEVPNIQLGAEVEMPSSRSLLKVNNVPMSLVIYCDKGYVEHS